MMLSLWQDRRESIWSSSSAACVSVLYSAGVVSTYAKRGSYWCKSRRDASLWIALALHFFLLLSDTSYRPRTPMVQFDHLCCVRMQGPATPDPALWSLVWGNVQSTSIWLQQRPAVTPISARWRHVRLQVVDAATDVVIGSYSWNNIVFLKVGYISINNGT